MRSMGFAIIAVLSAASVHADAVSETDAAFRKDLQLRLIQAKPGEVIELPAGRWTLNRSLSLNKSNVTLRGAGPDATVLSFKGQTQGAEGLLINAASHVTIENLAIEDTKGDGLKANGCKDLVLRNVRVEWTRGPNERNGAYGLYPVQSERVLIEHSVAIGASEAGIYAGQSKYVVLRNNRVSRNVAGMEIENSSFVDVYGNEVEGNAGGVLVFNVPGVPVKDGRRTRVFDNRIHDNNTENFAPKANLIFAVPAGTGVMVAVEVIPNRLSTAEALVRLIEDEDLSDVGICLDVGHARLQGEVVDAIETVAGYLVTTHVHDNRGRNDDHLVPFDGVIDWATTLMTLQKVGYTGTLMMELAASAEGPAVTLARAARARQRLESVLGEELRF